MLHINLLLLNCKLRRPLLQNRIVTVDDLILIFECILKVSVAHLKLHDRFLDIVLQGVDIIHIGKDLHKFAEVVELLTLNLRVDLLLVVLNRLQCQFLFVMHCIQLLAHGHHNAVQLGLRRRVIVKFH